MVFHASLRPALLSVLYSTSPSFRSRLAFSLTWANRGAEVDHGIRRHTRPQRETITAIYERWFAPSYLVGVDKEQDEEDEFSQEDDQQNDEKLKNKINVVSVTDFHHQVAPIFKINKQLTKEYTTQTKTLKRKHEWGMMGTVVYSRSAAGTYSPWWHPGIPGSPSPWRQCRGWWWGWRRRATGRRVTGWRSCPETPTATSRHPTVHNRPAGTHTGNSDTSCRLYDNTLTGLIILLQIYGDIKRTFSDCVCVCGVITQKSRLKRKSMYLMQQMQPRAMIESTGTARNNIQV